MILCVRVYHIIRRLATKNIKPTVKFDIFAHNNTEVIIMKLTPKETSLMKDLKDQEKLCAEKYARNASAAHDAQLKNLFSEISGVEQQHLQTLNQIESGAVPAPSGNVPAQKAFSATYTAENCDKTDDCFLCSDVLAAEKHASALYDTCIFEFTDESVRNALNHIQKEEQNHGKDIYDYMSVNSMY